jgi:hypothetical protein
MQHISIIRKRRLATVQREFETHTREAYAELLLFWRAYKQLARTLERKS